MKQVEEINYLLQFVTESEKDRFNKIYTEGVDKIKNKECAIQQIKNTILKKNKVIKNQKDSIEICLRDLEIRNEEIANLSNKIKDLERIISINEYAEKEIDRKISLFLQALERACVDNWEGYDIALDIYDEMLKYD